MNGDWAIKRIYMTQGCRCFYCGTKINRRGRKPTNPMGWTRDHFFPRSAGFTLLTGGKVLCCEPCNQRKANRFPTPDEIAKFADTFGGLPDLVAMQTEIA